MNTHALARPTKPRVNVEAGAMSHWAWLAGGFVVAFAIPFLLADLLEIHRDLFYGLYAIAVFGLVGLWARSTGYDLGAAVRRRWLLAVGLGAACAGVMALMVVRTEDATARPDGVELAGAVLWRGVVYGISDGLLLSVFPILVVFAALAGSRLNDRPAGKVVIGGIALIASLAMTAVYHLGYSDFRSDKVAKQLAGDVLWSVPTLVTLNPIGAPIAHVGLHVSAVLHSYETDTFLPPHVSGAPPAPASTAGLGESQRILDGLVSGAGRIAPGATAYVSSPDGTWAGASGLADVDTGEAIEPDARMRLESVSKIWTGAVVLRLAQEGRLDPSDTVERWLPGLLPYGDRITIAQLLTHTSGLIDNNDMAARPAAFIARVGDPVLRDQLTRVATRARTERAIEYSPKLWIKLASWQPLRSTPGTTFHYSNIGFEILGLIATRAAGRDLPSLYRDVITAPLALESAAYDPQGPISGPHPRGYLVAPSGGPLTDATDWHGGIGAEGGIIANAAETGRFLSGLMQGEVLDADWIARMKAGLFWTAPEPGACGSAFGHSGGGAGFKTDVLVSADGKRVAVLLMNGRAGSAGDDQAHRAIWQLYCAG
jgi:D-alanyl-D-alanine carboxypeptidase